ncbi:MAG TPA: glycosyltransferase family 2 protein [Chryseolinea sp.]
MPIVFVIIPVYNRRTITLQCLEQLRSNGDLGWLKVVVVDDRSPDGTGSAVKERFPEVDVIYGDGNLWWSGGIKMGMEYACQNSANFIVWLNDDCFPAPGCVKTLVEHATNSGEIALSAPFRGEHYYGGFLKTKFGLKMLPFSPDTIQACETFNGNLVCIPRLVVATIGYPDATRLPQCGADTDYGLRATSAGFRAVVVGAAKSWIRSEMHSAARSILRDKVTPADIVKSWFWKKSSLYAPAMWTYRTRHWHVIGIGLFFFETLTPLALSFWGTFAPDFCKLWPATFKTWFHQRHLPKSPSDQPQKT